MLINKLCYFISYCLFNIFIDILEDNILYDLTSFPGVKELERVSDSSSDAIYIPRGLVFGSEYVTFAYVSIHLSLY